MLMAAPKIGREPSQPHHNAGKEHKSEQRGDAQQQTLGPGAQPLMQQIDHGMAARQRRKCDRAGRQQHDADLREFDRSGERQVHVSAGHGDAIDQHGADKADRAHENQSRDEE